MNKLKSLTRVWSLCEPYHRPIIGSMAIMLLWQAVASTQPIYIGRAIARVTGDKGYEFVSPLLVWLALAMSRAVIFYLKERLEIRHLDYALMQHMSRMSLEKFFSISLGQHHLGHSLIKKSVMTKGEAAVAGMIWDTVSQLIPTLLTLVIPIIFLLLNAWQVGLGVIAAAIFFASFTIYYNGMFVPRLRKQDTIGHKINKKHGETVQNADVVYVNAQEERMKNECDIETAKMGETGIPMWCSYINWFYTGQWIIWVSQAACIALAGHLAIQGIMSKAMFVTCTWWVMNSIGTLTNISHIQRNMAKNIGPILKYFRFLDYEPDIVMPKDPVPLGHVRGQIEFKNVRFAYTARTQTDTLIEEDEEDEPVKPAEIAALKGVSFTIEAGRFYAIVGGSGAGKSTCVSLILRAFDPQEGAILVDGIDIRTLDFHELRKNIGVVPQEVCLFDGTIRYNVTFGLNGKAHDVTEAELDRIAKLSRLSEFSGKLEKGWNTMIGERGIKLSGGQRQRVGIARALIKDPPILIFDEATSSLDTENEQRIRESIREASVGKTTIVIAHRLATVRDADQILVLNEGTLVGQGSHEELLKTNEYYQRLVHNQVIVA